MAIAASLALAGCGKEGGSSSPAAQNPPLAGAAIGGPFALTDKNGKIVRWEDFAGKYRIVYFGYTFCPDACPMDLQNLMAGFAAFEKAKPALAAQIQPIFITIDPARDTPQIVGEFTSAFSPRLLGLTGTSEQIEKTAKEFAVFYAKGQESAGGYLMDHSRTAFLMDRDGKPMALLSVDQGTPQEAAANVAAELTKWVR